MVQVQTITQTFITEKDVVEPTVLGDLFPPLTITTVYSMTVTFIEKQGDEYFWQATMVFDGSIT